MEPARSRGMVWLHPKTTRQTAEAAGGLVFAPIACLLRQRGEWGGDDAIGIVALEVRARVCGGLLGGYRCRSHKAGGSDSLRHASVLRSICEARLDPSVDIALKPSDGTPADADGTGEGPALDKQIYRGTGQSRAVFNRPAT